MGFQTAATVSKVAHASDPHVLTVAEVCDNVRVAVRGIAQPVFVRGELRDVVRAASGHVYFSLRQDGAMIACVLFRREAAWLAPRLKEGAAVVVQATFDFYAPRGQAQLIVHSVHAQGMGDRWAAFEETRRALKADGLFDASRKRPLPRFPRRIGLVTSESGEAFHDVVQTLRRRFPATTVVLSPALVQGVAAPPSLVAALRRLRRTAVDVIILTRGGGSTEDLWAFNDEALARAIAASPVPVVAAVGHETDVTIASMVADLSAATPSAAAFRVAPDVSAIRDRLETIGARLGESVVDAVREVRRRLDDAHRGFQASRDRIESRRERLDALRLRLEALGPGPTLRRGYAIVRRGPSLLGSAALARVGDLLHITFQDGEITCRVTKAKG